MDENKKVPDGQIPLLKISQETLKKQIEGYDSLGIFHSARKISSLLLLLSATITILLIVFLGVDVTAYLDVAILIILAIFVYNGYKWAIVAAMILWTYEKGYQIFETLYNSGSGTNVIVPIIWWIVFMREFWLAYRVEVERKRQLPPVQNI